MDDLTKRAYGLRRDIIEEVYRSGAGHVGGDLSVIDILTVLYFGVMNVSPNDRESPDRDRFFLSKGHCADALYMVLGEKGFFDKQEAIDTFSAYGSKFIGHPNRDVPGIEMNSGSLGHGLALGVGTALAAKMDGRAYRTYVVLGDGEMAEGSNYEAMMAAGHYRLDNLCATVDLNRLQISGKTADVMCSDDLAGKFRAFGWHVTEVEDGNDCGQLLAAYEAAAAYREKPTAVIAHTVKGKGVSFMEDQAGWHHGVLKQEQYRRAVAELEEKIQSLPGEQWREPGKRGGAENRKTTEA
ncbi:MAG: transketolase [Lachnospiraceae bacterium]|nr:transketolase [Lachnospiraceae bacterium]